MPRSPSRTRRRGVPALLALAACAGAARGQAYILTDLGGLGGGQNGTVSIARALNAKGQVTGHAPLLNTSDRAFLWSFDTGMRDLGTLPGSAPVPGVVGSIGYAVNDAGDVAGQSLTPDGAYHAFVHHAGTMEDVAPPGAGVSRAMGVNSHGDALVQVDGTGAFLWTQGRVFAMTGFNGAALNDAGAAAGNVGGVAALWSGGAARALCSLCALGPHLQSYAYAVNNAGEIAGEMQLPGAPVPWHAFLYSGGRMSDLGALPNDAKSAAYAINDAGDVVGTSGTDALPYRAVLWRDGVITDINTLVALPPGYTLTEARGINATGQIAGTATSQHDLRAFLLTPGRYGDVNNDGRVDAADALAVLRCAAGSAPLPSNPMAGDVAPNPSPAATGFGDGKLDTRDALRILRYANGLETRWP